MDSPTYTNLVDTQRQPGSELFQDAALQGLFKLPRCQDCQRTYWYPRPVCPRCLSGNVAWETASGQGTVYSFTVMRRARPAYVIAYVKLEEGPVMMTNLVNCSFDEIHIGMQVKAVFQADGNGNLVPLFEPAHPRGE